MTVLVIRMNGLSQDTPCAPTLSILLADDHAKVLESATQLLQESYRIAGTAANGASALLAAERLCPDIIVLDIAMPQMDGIETARALRRSGSAAKIIFLTVLQDEAYVSAARCYGNGYVLKSRMYSDLPRAIEEALLGNFFVSLHQNSHPD